MEHDEDLSCTQSRYMMYSSKIRFPVIQGIFCFNCFFLSRNADNDFADLIRVAETGVISDVSLEFLILPVPFIHLLLTKIMSLLGSDTLCSKIRVLCF